MTLFRFTSRLAIALAMGASATLPWVDRTPNTFERALTVVSIAVALIMLVSIAKDFRLPLRVVEWAAAVATVAFVTDGMESILSQEQREASIVRTALFTFAAAVISLGVMIDQRRRRMEGGP